MKGLLIKDLQLLKKQKIVLAFAAFLSVIFLFYGTSSIQFIVCYITILFSFMSTTTIVYDQHSNGMGFLLTLPVSRSSYAWEKYLLMLFVMAGSLAISFTILLAGVCIQRIPFDGDLLLKVLLSSALLSVLTHALLIPLQLKFEAEKGRVVFMVIIGLVYAVIFGGRALILHFHIDVPALFRSLVSRAGTTALTLLLYLAVAGILGISFLVSLHVMKTKEY